MSDWQVGDLAVCVDASPRLCKCGKTHLGSNATQGQIIRVAGIISTPNHWCVLTQTLLWDGAGEGGALASRFRKILPDKHEECEPEFVTLLKRIKIGVAA